MHVQCLSGEGESLPPCNSCSTTQTKQKPSYSPPSLPSTQSESLQWTTNTVLRVHVHPTRSTSIIPNVLDDCGDWSLDLNWVCLGVWGSTKTASEWGKCGWEAVHLFHIRIVYSIYLLSPSQRERDHGGERQRDRQPGNRHDVRLNIYWRHRIVGGPNTATQKGKYFKIMWICAYTIITLSVL